MLKSIQLPLVWNVPHFFLHFEPLFLSNGNFNQRAGIYLLNNLPCLVNTELKVLLSRMGVVETILLRRMGVVETILLSRMGVVETILQVIYEKSWVTLTT